MVLVANRARLWRFVLACNLSGFMRRLVLPEAMKRWSLTSLGTRLINTGGRLVRRANGLPQGSGMGRDRRFWSLVRYREVATPRERSNCVNRIAFDALRIPFYSFEESLSAPCSGKLA